MGKINLEKELMKDEIIRLREQVEMFKWGINGCMKLINDVDGTELNKRGNDLTDGIMFYLTSI